ncbi:TIGR03905 family TSCPD domain-containing protein [Anaerofustis sp.]|uniref:TIGR03905 family TSCPD domain-containing protein n=1 Tax=Anaerofustis sp. TaxID=1872517 RepID=UPI0025C4CE68|nr:TIGR03905 family TSCPD domain-containing protein [Anaerofustis sp.]
MKYKYKTKGTCSTEITFDINNDVITNVKFTGGCNGNLQAVSKLVDGLKAEEIEAKLKGIHCGMRNTSCADQLTIAIKEAQNKQKG